MVQTLFEVSSLVIRNAVVTGQISTVGHLPLVLRRWIFEVFRMKRLLDDSSVVRLLGQPGFFDGFTTIRMHEDHDGCVRPDSEISRVFDGSFVTSLVTVFDADRSLAEDIAELSLGFSAVRCSTFRLDETRELVENVSRLLSICNNLKRLQLVAHAKFNDEKQHCMLAEFPLRSDIIENECRPTLLEHLSLIGCTNYFYLKWLPGRWFESLQSLELCFVRRDFDTYLDVLTACRHTLTSLTLKHVRETHNDVALCPIPIRLPKLTWLRFESEKSTPRIFEKILDHCPNLIAAMVKMRIDEITDAQLIAIDRLSERLQLDLTVKKSVPNFAKLIEIAGRSFLGLSVHRSSLTNGDYDLIYSNCVNLRRLALYGINEIKNTFLRRIFSDQNRAANLIDVELCGDLSTIMLKSLFTNVRNLNRLTLTSLRTVIDIRNDVRVWVENGARPTSIGLYCFQIDRETVFSVIKICGRSLKYMNIPIRTADEDVYKTSLDHFANYCPSIGCFILDHVFRVRKTNRYMSLVSKFERVCFNYKPYYVRAVSLKD